MPLNDGEEEVANSWPAADTEHALANDLAEFSRVKNFIHNPPVISPIYIDQLVRKHGTEVITESYLSLLKGDIQPRIFRA